MIKQHTLDREVHEKMIIILDCWSVHRGKALAAHIKVTFPWLILIFIPANCTCSLNYLSLLYIKLIYIIAVFQPCDVGLQRVVKHIIRREASKFFVTEVREQLKTGTLPTNIKLSNQLSILRNQTPSWLMNAIDYLNDNPILAKKAWSNCQTGKWNLSYECVTSRAAKIALLDKSNQLVQLPVTHLKSVALIDL